MSQENIFPEHYRVLPRAARESLTAQLGRVIWLYGLSGSGKSTLSRLLENALHAQGRLCVVLDGDNLRTGLNSGLGFSPDDRRENIRRAAEVARLFVDTGIIVIGSFICPFRSLRELARQIITPDDFLEVYVHASLQSCSRRDPKGLYKKASEGKVAHFTGRDSVFEPPDSSFTGIRLDTEAESPAQCVEKILATVQPWIRHPATPASPARQPAP